MKHLLMVAVAALFVGSFAHAEGAATADTSATKETKSEQNADGSAKAEKSVETKDAAGKKHTAKHSMKKKADGSKTEKTEETTK